MNDNVVIDGRSFLENFNPNLIWNLDGARQAISSLLNLVESLNAENRALREENQRLQDEINRLKGVTSRPNIKANPTDKDRVRLANEFDVLFSTVTGYDDLDERISKTKAKKENMLPVLKHPEIPLHNNASVPKFRDACSQTKNQLWSTHE
jgi:seryl-tRNA synthetase